MAAIDKIYVNNWKDLCDIREYFENTKFLANNGTYCVLKDYLYDTSYITEDMFDGIKEFPVTNTPTKVDYFLAMHCPLKPVQDYLDHAYEGWRDYDYWKQYILFDRNPGTKIKTIKRPKFGNINKSLNNKYGWHIHVHTPKYYKDHDVWYNEYPTYYKKTNQWIYRMELEFPDDKEWWCCFCGYKTIKALIRNIRKWKLPKGTIVDAYGRYIGEEYKFLIK